MVCFNSETAASQVLNRSTNLVKSASYGHIYIKRDLPRDQRPPPRKSNSRVAEAARGASAETMPIAVTSASPPATARRKFTDRSHSSSSSSPPPSPAGSVYITLDETFGDDKGEGVNTTRW